MTTQRLTWLADVLRRAGLPVREIAGWQSRGHGEMADVLGVLCHHTAGPRTGNYPSENVVVNGRPGLEGPLANLGLARDGTWVIVSAGQAWHAGTGSVAWCPANTGNTHLIGVEAESCGVVDDWSDAQRGSYPRGVAALLSHLGLPASRAIAHREWAPARKIDIAFWDMTQFRADVARWQSVVGVSPAAPTVPRRTIEDDAMYIKYTHAPGDIWYALLSGPIFVGLGSPGERKAADDAIKAGAAVQWVEAWTWNELDKRSHALCDNPRPVAVTNSSTGRSGTS
jgi:hypothetical protein